MIERSRAMRLARFAILSSPAWVFAAWAILHIFTRPTEFQIDLASYYGGARAFLADSNAYAATNHPVQGGAAGPIFAVPPISLYVFQLLPSLEYLSVYYLWLVVKLCALAVLVTLWYRHFISKRDSPFALLLLVFAYNSALIDDLNLGNIALFEELLIWLAFLALLRGKTVLFCALIIFAAQFKVQPFLLLGLLLVVPERPQWKALIASMVVGAAAFSTNRLLLPELTREYMRIARTLDQRGANNESTLALVRDLAGIPAGQELHSVWTAAGLGYYGIAIFVAVVTLAAIVSYKRNAPRPDPKLVIGLCCMAFALVTPRMKGYGYVLLLVPTWQILAVTTHRKLAAVTIALVVISANYVRDAVLSVVGDSFVYWSLVAAWAVWLLYVVELWTQVGGPRSEVRVVPS